MRPAARGQSRRRYDVPVSLTPVTNNTTHFDRVGDLILDNWS